MILLDTNILVRFLVRDDEIQFQKVLHFLQDLENNQKQAFISLLVLIELNWVLSFRYKIARQDIIHEMINLCHMPIFDIEHNKEVKQALLYAQNNTFDLSDLLIACKSRSLDNLPVYTFDKKASRAEGFVLL